MLIKFGAEGKMESSIQDGYLTIKTKVVKIEELEKYIGQHRAFVCTDKSVRIDTHDRNIIEKMLNCMEKIVAKEEEKQYFISKFHHKTLKKFFDTLYKLLFETDKLRHFNNCVDKDGNLYVSTLYAGM
jgi:lysyl-tRNA synthetase class I